MTKNFFIVGLVRDQEELLPSIIQILSKSFSKYGRIFFFIVESDSKDCTVQALDRLREEIVNFDYVSLGNLELTKKDRWVRMAILRNVYLDKLQSLNFNFDSDFLVVADLDDVNLKLKSDSLESIFDRKDWAGVFANQSAYYYDVLALRHPMLSPNDCWKEERNLISEGMNPYLARKRAIFDRQIRIPRNSQWIEVDSAFGGLAIYRISSILGCKYNEESSEGELACEHIDFHSQIRAKGGKLFIVPSLINAHFVDHTNAKKVYPKIKWSVKFVFWELQHFQKHKIRFLKRYLC